MNPSTLKRLILGLLIVGLFILASLYLTQKDPQSSASGGTDPASSTEAPQRLVCLAPSLTEILFAIGAGPNVVGVSSFTTFPPEAAELPKLGGHHDPNLEAMVALNPDHIVTMHRIDKVSEQAQALNLNITELPTDTVEELLSAIRHLGRLTHRTTEAEALAKSLETGLESLRQRTQKRLGQNGSQQKPPRVLIVVGRKTGAIDGIYSVSGNSFLNTLLEAAGAQNAITLDKNWPPVPVEMVIRAAPDVIFEITAQKMTPEALEKERSARLQLWRDALPHLPAMQKGQLFLLAGDHLLLPGPRLLQIAEAFENVLEGLQPTPSP